MAVAAMHTLLEVHSDLLCYIAIDVVTGTTVLKRSC
jgi:hypothetical protein